MVISNPIVENAVSMAQESHVGNCEKEESDEIKIVILLTLIGDAGINIFNTLYHKRDD